MPVAAEIGAAGSTAALEELRVGYLGRKAELTTILRGIAELPPEERGAVGGAANKARKELEALLEAGLRPPRRRRARRQAGRRPGRRHPAGGAAAAGRPLAPDRPHHAADRGRDGRARLRGRRRPGDRARLLQLHRAEPSRGPPGADAPGHLLRPVTARRPAAHPHLADADPGDGDPAAADLRDRPRQGLPARLRRHPQPDVPPDRGPGDRRGDHARRPQGDAAGALPGDLRRPTASCACARTSSPSPSPASRSTSPASSAAAAAP